MASARRLDGRRRWRVILQDAGDHVLDRLLGIDTAGWVQHERLEFDERAGRQYQPSNWLNLVLVWRRLRSLGVTKQDVFLDLGCGKGQVLLLAGRFPFGRIVGVDLSPSMLEIARGNVARWASRLRCPVELVQADAAQYAIPRDVTVCYLYRPFPTEVFVQVARHLGETIAAYPRPMRMLYLHPTPEDRAVPLAHGFREVRCVRGLVEYEHRSAT